PAPGTLDAYVNAAHPHVERITRALLRRDRRRKRRRLLRALESRTPGAPPRHDVPLHVRDRHQGIVERRLDGRDPLGVDTLARTLRARALLRIRHSAPLARSLVPTITSSAAS